MAKAGTSILMQQGTRGPEVVVVVLVFGPDVVVTGFEVVVTGF